MAPRGRAVKLPKARATADHAPASAVVVVHAAKRKEPWRLATSLAERKTRDIITPYGKRFSMEETFRDENDLPFGLGRAATVLRSKRAAFFGTSADNLLCAFAQTN